MKLLPTVCIAALLLALVWACSGSSKTAPDGPRLFMGQGCVTCHKLQGEGGPLGPALRNIASRWTAEELSKYLVDPRPYVEKDPRLQALSRTYRMPMPGVRVSPQHLRLLVDYVLSL